MIADLEFHEESESSAKSADPISLALQQLRPNVRRRKEATFATHFAEIEVLIQQGVSQKDIRKALAEAGLALSPATFKKLLECERSRRTGDTNEEHQANGGAA